MSTGNTAENVEAAVKLEALISGLGSWVPTGDPNTVVWLNSWLGPHWILVPDRSGVFIQRLGTSVYNGPLGGFPDCQAVFAHRVGMKMCDDETQSLIYDLASELEDLLRRAWDRLQPFDLQRAVQGFFQQRRR